MINQPWNATSAKEYFDKQKENAKQIKMQIDNLQKQTKTLTDIEKLTGASVECAKNIADLTTKNVEIADKVAQMVEENQKSSSKYFWASIIVSIVALIVSILK